MLGWKDQNKTENLTMELERKTSKYILSKERKLKDTETGSSDTINTGRSETLKENFANEDAQEQKVKYSGVKFGNGNDIVEKLNGLITRKKDYKIKKSPWDDNTPGIAKSINEKCIESEKVRT